MKQILILICSFLFLISCEKESGQINVVLDKRFGKQLFELNISSEDSIVYKSKTPIPFYNHDTIRFSKLHSGKYRISYLDVLGKTKVTEINLTGGDTILIKPEPNTVNIDSFFSKTPISNIKDNQQYIIKVKGGCVATMEGWYTIEKEKSQIYFTSARGKKILLDKNALMAVKQFEGELLAVNGVNICNSSGRMTYTIIKEKDTLEITDNTCMWDGWSRMYKKIYIK